MDQTKDIGGESIGNLRFADDISLLAKQEKGLGLQETLTGVAKVSKNGHEDKHTEYRMSIFGGGKQEVSPGGRRTGIGANGELCVSRRDHQHTRRDCQGCGKENWAGEGNSAGAGEGVELQGTEQGHKNTHVRGAC